MKLSVTHRIAGGYGVVLLLALGILLTGLIAIQRINASLLLVVDETTPMLNQSASLQTSLLHAQTRLMQHQQFTKLDQLSVAEEALATYQQANQTALLALQDLTQDDVALSNLVSDTNAALTSVFELIPKAIAHHRSELEQATRVGKQKRQFGDMADEVESIAAELGRDARALATLLGNMRQQAENSLEKNNVAAVANAEKELRDSLNEADAMLGQLAASQRGQLSSPYNRFKTALMGDDGLLKAYQRQLSERKNTQTKTEEVMAAASAALTQTQGLSDQIQALNETVKTQAADTVSHSRWLLMVFALLAFSIATWIGFQVVQSIRLPLQSVVSTIKNMATGDLRRSIELHREDELGDVANCLRDLIIRLREMLTAIHENSERLAAAAEQTSAISNTTLNNISRQKEQTEMVATAVTEMAATVDEVAKSANRTLQQVESTGAETRDGQRVFQENRENIRQLAAEIDRATTVVSRVSTESNNIGAVLDVIRGVAEQTNLLALNAAIEAARAGEQGRGFAVVADEVRTLASRSQNSTAEIQDIIKRLQDGTREAVNVMDDSRREAQVSVSNVELARDALQRISQSVGVIKDMSTQIASAADEQNAVTQELHRNIATIAEAAEQNAEGARENQAASLELARLAAQQKVLANQFVLG